MLKVVCWDTEVVYASVYSAHTGQKVAAYVHIWALNVRTCSAPPKVSQSAFGGEPQDGKGQPRAGVNSTFKRSGGGGQLEVEPT